MRREPGGIGLCIFSKTRSILCMLKKGGRTPEAMLAEVTYTRYRGGVLGDFTSRLHYTTDWFYDNQQKKVIHMLAPYFPGAVPFTQKVSVMSDHAKQYRQLAAHPELVPKIKHFEDQINARHLMYIPLDKLEAIESKLQTGDIVAVCANEPGTDIPHTGLVYVDDSGVPHFMDASSMKRSMKVTLEPEPIHRAFYWSKQLTGGDVCASAGS